MFQKLIVNFFESFPSQDRRSFGRGWGEYVPGIRVTNFQVFILLKKIYDSFKICPEFLLKFIRTLDKFLLYIFDNYFTDIKFIHTLLIIFYEVIEFS